ncbi:hypothetical protein HPP92_014782 [Vanilla planifolia]|uniref:Bet v I/Major latex protein domain-containing protein n=1 Tax=Vanilla planifolia TaxID=51239 RepID=A0A835QQ68_VANPL|nr:hypothetical protein HPP92_015289 [Vanilla planifolia]KAG0475096.1 hypothetical protein HPP92_014782 [Vanilla planifolia]
MVEVEVSSPADKFWAAIQDSATLFPKIFPKQFKSIEIIEGDGKGVGSIRALSLAEGIPHTKFSKEKIEIADNENKLITYSVIEGDLLSLYKTFRPTLQVIPKGEGALVKWSVEYEKVSDKVPDPEVIQNLVVITFKELDAYLLKN